MFLSVLEFSNGLLGFPAVLGGIPDEFSIMLIYCVLKISVSFNLSPTSLPLFYVVIFSLVLCFPK